jgi:heme oxygenase (mycobilin-producing)
MYVSMSRLRVPVERAAQLVTAFRSRVGLVDEADGFVDLQVWQSDRDAGELIMVSRWRDREAFKTYMRSAEHRVSHDRIDPDLQAAIKLERLEHLRTYEVVAE